MGKKTKIGKARRDKFYQLAKEIGYRSRASFKLIQLNRKYEFLQKSRVCIDLCAAPGGWLQVASQNMPVSSLIVGVDLVSIKPIPHTITLQEDITTEKCRRALRKELQTWKADVVLNDGAPNVGKNWLHDAFTQSQLTLHAFKIATEFLKKGGWFITKVFRSKDYQSLMWVFEQLFKKVHATKPQASRNESAEIFVVCQGYLAPDKLDPKFTDPKHIFKDVTEEPKNALNLIHPEKSKRHREGYAEGDYTLYHKLDVTKFIESDTHLTLLANCNEITLNDEEIKNNPLTNTEVKACCQDIKVLGKKEIRLLLNWRMKIRKLIQSKNEGNDEDIELKEKSDDDEDEEEKIDEQIMELKEAEAKQQKKKLKKVRREKTKLRQKMDMKMVLPGDHVEMGDDINLFDVKKIKNKKELDQVETSDIELAASSDSDEQNSDADLYQNKKHTSSYDRFNKGQDPYDEGVQGSEESEEEKLGVDDELMEEKEFGDEEEDDEEGNPLLVDMEDKSDLIQRKTALWFRKDIFKDIENEEDEDLEVDIMAEQFVKKGGVISGRKEEKHRIQASTNENTMSKKNLSADVNFTAKNSDSKEDASESDSESDESDESGDSDSDYDIDEAVRSTRKEMLSDTKEKKKNNPRKDGFEIVPVEQPAQKRYELDAISLAIGSAMVESKKRKRDIIDQAYNRYTFNDVGLPDWFVKDESKHNKPQLPVTKAEIQECKERQKAINVRPVKKIAEAKARKKQKVMKKLEKARKKANAISDTLDTSEKEKWSQIKSIYKRAGVLSKKKQEVTYVVIKKGAGKRVSRPAGVKGRFKVVDPRMKKDMRKEKNKSASQKRSSSKGRSRSTKHK